MAEEAAALPAGWQSAVDPETGRAYYVNEAFGTTQWDPPGASDAVDAEMLAAIAASKEAQQASNEDEAMIAALAASAETAEIDWISDCLFAVFSAPTWVAPISTFIDEHCSIFEDMEENKLEYTPIHNAFKQLVDDLLTAHLIELAVTPEQFENFCRVGMQGEKALQRSIVEQLLSVEDFIIFKAMMVKRSAALHHETLMAEPPTPAPTVKEGEEVDPAEQERLDAQRRCVEAELQLAIALSLQLEQRLRLVEALEERLRLMEKLTEMMEMSSEMAEQQDEEAAAAATAEADAPAEVPSVAAVAAAAAEQAAAPAEETIPTVTRLQPLAPLRVGPGHGPSAAPLLGSTTMSSSSVPPLSDAEKFALEKRRTEAALRRANQTPGSPAGAAAAAPEPQAAQAFEPAPAPPPPAAPAPVHGPTEEERKARAEHLKRQRAVLLEKKRAEREQQLNLCPKPQQAAAVRAAGRAADERATGFAPADAGRSLVAELSGEANASAEAEQRVAQESAAAAEMRRTITRQLKQTLMSSLEG